MGAYCRGQWIARLGVVGTGRDSEVEIPYGETTRDQPPIRSRRSPKTQVSCNSYSESLSSHLANHHRGIGLYVHDLINQQFKKNQKLGWLGMCTWMIRLSNLAHTNSSSFPKHFHRNWIQIIFMVWLLDSIDGIEDRTCFPVFSYYFILSE